MKIDKQLPRNKSLFGDPIDKSRDISVVSECLGTALAKADNAKLKPLGRIARHGTHQRSTRKQLRDCWNSLMHDGNGDVTLAVGETEFKAHSLFLAQSPVLEELISQSNRINIPALSIEAFEPFLQYLYTGKVQSLDKYAKELMTVASKYKLKIRMQMCNLVLNQSSA